MRPNNVVGKWLEDEVDAVEIVPDKRKTSGTQGLLNMDGARGFEYTWRLNAYPEDNSDSDAVYREHIQSDSGEYLTARRSLLKGTDFEPSDPEAEEHYRSIAEQRAEELADELGEVGIEAHIDYDSFEDPEVNWMRQTPKSKR